MPNYHTHNYELFDINSFMHSFYDDLKIWFNYLGHPTYRNLTQFFLKYHMFFCFFLGVWQTSTTSKFFKTTSNFHQHANFKSGKNVKGKFERCTSTCKKSTVVYSPLVYFLYTRGDLISNKSRTFV